MTEPQTKYLRKAFRAFCEDLTTNQIIKFAFRLDDLIQYGPDAVHIAYKEVIQVERERLTAE